MSENKFLHFTSKYKEKDVTLHVSELLDKEYGLFIWPSAPVLAQYVFLNSDKIVGKHILELGAGTALAGCMAAKLGAHVTLSDTDRLPHCLQRCRENVAVNSLQGVSVLGITWGEFNPALINLEHVDVMLGSDCFYDTKDFEKLIVTVSYLMEKNPKAEFWTTYQERSSKRSIQHLLMKWKLIGEEIPLKQFEADVSDIAGSGCPGNHTIKMFIIKRETG